jgi:iron(II)-dependent oxidoreductase
MGQMGAPEGMGDMGTMQPPMGMQPPEGMGAMGTMQPEGMRPAGMRPVGEAWKPPKPTLNMVLVKGGTFNQGRKGGSKYEGPPIKGVKVATFWLDAAEVDRAAYARYLAGPGKDVRSPWKTRQPEAKAGQLPVVLVTWQEAGQYCKALGKRLPTEAEWEYAARGETHDKLYPWGDKFDASRVVSSVLKPGSLQAVQSGKAVGGFYHLSGNAWEWVATQYKPYPGSRAGKAVGTQYVIRGGGVDARKPGMLTATYRVFNYGHKNPRSGKLAIYRYLGFRCAFDQKSEESK